MILIPVAPYLVTYEVLTRRAIVELDCFILWAIGRESINTVEELEKEFRVHRRVVIECLLRLFEMGLIGLPDAGTAHFAVTRKAERWLSGYSEPSGKMIISEPGEPTRRRARVIRELVTGRLERNIRVATPQQLGEAFESAVKVPVDASPMLLSESELRRVLPVQPGEWIHRLIGMPTPDGSGFVYRAVEVDLESQRVLGLPDSWQPSLSELLLHTARASRASGRSGGAIPTDSGSEYLAALSVARSDCFFNGGIEQYVTMLLTSSENSQLLVLLSHLSTADLDRWSEQLASALSRGNAVDLIWGSSDSTPRQLADHCAVIRDKVSASSRQLRLNIAPLAIASNVLFKIDANDKWEGAVSSCPWLAEAVENAVGVRLVDSSMLASAMLTSSAFLEAHLDVLDAVSPLRWREAALRLYAAPYLIRRTDTESSDLRCKAGWLRARDVGGYQSRLARSSNAAFAPDCSPGHSPIFVTEHSLLIGCLPQAAPDALQLGLIAECTEWATALGAAIDA